MSAFGVLAPTVLVKKWCSKVYMSENELENISICTKSYTAFISIDDILIETEFHHLSREIV